MLADEDGRDVPELGEVERLVEGADVGRSVAEERHGHPRFAPQLEGERGADDAGKAAADDGVCTEVPALEVVEVHRAAVAVAAALDLPVELGHDLVGMGSLRDRVAVGPVGRGDDVTLLERAADPHCDGLLADRHVEEAGKLAGSETLLHLLLETADEQHLPKEVLQALRRRGLPLFLEGCQGDDKLAAREGAAERSPCSVALPALPRG